MGSSTTELWQAVASSTGEIITDSFPLWYVVLGLLATLFACMLILSGIKWIARHILKVV